jgi:hypothetical protein
VEVILKRAERFKPDREIGSFLINAAQLTSDRQGSVCGISIFLIHIDILMTFFELQQKLINHQCRIKTPRST